MLEKCAKVLETALWLTVDSRRLSELFKGSEKPLFSFSLGPRLRRFDALIIGPRRQTYVSFVDVLAPLE